MRTRLSWRKRLLFSAMATCIAAGAIACVALGADLALHRKVEKFSGVNIWGYRGPTVGRKKPGEHRLVVVGGSTAFGYGVDWNKAFPAQLETALRPIARNQAPVTVVNLGFNSQGAYSFKFALEDYAGLDYDAAVLYEGYNDCAGEDWNYYVGRRDSPLFRLTGYFPMLPLYFHEKAMALRAGGDLAAAYSGKTVFKPGLATRTAAGALDAGVTISAALNRQLERLATSSAISRDRIHVAELGCRSPWQFYCGAVYDAIQFSIDHGKRVLVVTQPYIARNHREQQVELRTMLQARFRANPKVMYADLGDTVNLADHSIAYDGMHLNPEGNGMIARALVTPLARLMPEAFDAPRPQEPPAR